MWHSRQWQVTALLPMLLLDAGVANLIKLLLVLTHSAVSCVGVCKVITSISRSSAVWHPFSDITAMLRPSPPEPIKHALPPLWCIGSSATCKGCAPSIQRWWLACLIILSLRLHWNWWMKGDCLKRMINWLLLGGLPNSVTENKLCQMPGIVGTFFSVAIFYSLNVACMWWALVHMVKQKLPIAGMWNLVHRDGRMDCARVRLYKLKVEVPCFIKMGWVSGQKGGGDKPQEGGGFWWQQCQILIPFLGLICKAD